MLDAIRHRAAVEPKVRPTHELVFVSWTRLARSPTGRRPLDRVDRPRGRQHPSTVAYWVQQARPDVPARAPARRPRRHRARDARRRSSSEGLSIREIARAARRELRRPSALAARKYELEDAAAAATRGADAERRRRSLRECPIHGWTASSARARRLLPLPARAGRGGRAAPPAGQGDPGRGGGRRVRALRLRRVRRRAALPSPRSARRSVRWLAAGRHPIAASGARGGAQVRATVRELPRRGRGGTRCSCRPRRYSVAVRGADRSGVAQWQSIRLLTEGLWVRVPPPEPLQGRPSRRSSSFWAPGGAPITINV